MNEDRSNEPLDKAAETAARIVRAAGQTEKIAHSIQAVHAATGAVRAGGCGPAVPRWEPRWGDRLEH